MTPVFYVTVAAIAIDVTGITPSAVVAVTSYIVTAADDVAVTSDHVIAPATDVPVTTSGVVMDVMPPINTPRDNGLLSFAPPCLLHSTSS